MLTDYHVHCEFSDDSVYPMEDVVRDAIGLGLEEICFTDHVDYGIKVDWDSGEEIRWRNGEPFANVDYPRYFAKIADLQEKYGDRIGIRRGLELGVQSHTIDAYNRLTEKYPLDFAILSIHQVHDQEFWNGEFQEGARRRSTTRSTTGRCCGWCRVSSTTACWSTWISLCGMTRRGCIPLRR